MNRKHSGITKGPLNKWNAIHSLIRNQQIGIMALQETHLTKLDILTLKCVYGRTL